MSTFQGIGTTFYGKKYFNPIDKSYITIKWFVLFLLPIAPLKAYKIIMGDTKASFSGLLSVTKNYQILGEVPLKMNLDLIFLTYLKIYGGIISFLWGFGYPILFIIPIILIINFFISESKINKAN